MQSVLRSLQVLEAVAAHQPIRVGELVPILNLPKSTVQRSLATLQEAGWLESIDGDLTRWKLSERALSLLQPSPLADVDLRASAFGPMQELCSATNETAHLFVPHGATHVVVLDRAECTRSIRTVIPLGSVLPSVGSASGLMMLAAGSDADLAEALETARTHRGGVTDTPSPEQIEVVPKLVAEARMKGYAKRLAWDGDVVGIGSIVRDRGGRVVAGVSLSIPVGRYDERGDDEWGAPVMHCTSQISAAIGYRPPRDG